MTNCAELELTFTSRQGADYLVDFRCRMPGSQAEVRLGGGTGGVAQPLVSLPGDLFTQEDCLDLLKYGEKLSQALFASPDLKREFENACLAAEAQGLALQIRLWFANGAAGLHDLAWEALQHPKTNLPLSTSPKYYFSRYLASDNWAKTELPAQASLKALVVVADPLNLPDYKLARVQLDAEIERATRGLGATSTAILPANGQPASLLNIMDQLRAGADILYLVCHGYMTANGGVLCLEDDRRQVALVTAENFAAEIARLPKPPVLLVLVSCQSGGNLKENSNAQAIRAAGPKLVAAGIPAVVAMQSALSMQTAAQFMPTFLSELLKDGQIDRALALARSRVLPQSDWWVPVLFSRLNNNLLFLLPSVPLVSKGLEALGEMLKSSSELRANVGQFHNDFETTCRQLDRLADYKDLHDMLHSLQFEYYTVAFSAAARFPDDDNAVDELARYQPRLDEIADNLNAILARASISPLEKMWVQKVISARASIQKAREENQKLLLDDALQIIYSVINNQPTRINGVLTEAARGLRLSNLVGALTAVGSQVRQLDPDLVYVNEFSAGLQAMSAVDNNLAGLVSQHDLCQAVEIELRNFEVQVDAKQLDQLKSYWPGVRDMALDLYKDNPEEWARRLRDGAAALDAAIPAGDPGKIRQSFRAYRSMFGLRFFKVDTNLKNLSSEIRQIGIPLNAVLRIIE